MNCFITTLFFSLLGKLSSEQKVENIFVAPSYCNVPARRGQNLIRCILQHSNKGNAIFCKCILLVLQRYRLVEHSIFTNSGSDGWAKNWEYIIVRHLLVFKEATAVKVCPKTKDCTSPAHTCADQAPDIYPSNVRPGGATQHV